MPTAGEFYDSLETEDAHERDKRLFAALPAHIAKAQCSSSVVAAKLKGIVTSDIRSWGALANLPLTRKHELIYAGGAHDGASRFWPARYGSEILRVFASPGPIFEPEGKARDYYRMARALFAAGFRPGDLLHNCFSYHLVPAGSIIETGAHALGCTVFPGGTGQTEQQVHMLAALKPAGYVGTPSFLKLIVEKSKELTGSPPRLERALFGGEAYPKSLHEWFAGLGVDGYQFYATADIGLIAYETSARGGLVVDEGILLEIVEPGSGMPVEDGQVGEVVVTSLNPTYPLIRFATGDLSRVISGTCPTGRTNKRIQGWMGRADETTKVRGMFVHPHQVTELLKRFPEVTRGRIVVSGEPGEDSMTLEVEAVGGAELAARLQSAIKDVMKLRGEVRIVPYGFIAPGAKIIEDHRKYD